MFIRKLHYLVALSRERHFGRAAARCHVSQSALSVAIQNLEQELNIAIVQRGNKRFLGFTGEGMQVLLWAQRILADYENLRQGFKAGDCTAVCGTFKIGAIPAVLPLIPKPTQSSLRNFPAVHYEVYTLSALEILRRLGSYELDIGVSYMDDAQLRKFSSLWIFRERYLLMYSRKNAPLERLVTSRNNISWQQAAGLPLCLFINSLQCRQGMDKAFAEAGVAATPLVETDSLTVLYGQVLHGGLYGIFPSSTLCNGIAPNRDIIVRPMQTCAAARYWLDCARPGAARQTAGHGAGERAHVRFASLGRWLDHCHSGGLTCPPGISLANPARQRWHCPARRVAAPPQSRHRQPVVVYGRMP